MNRATRRGAITAVLTTASGAIVASASAKPIVTNWDRLARRARTLTRWQAFHRVGYAPTNRELARQVTRLTELVADLTDALAEKP